ncbi:MAG: hypothetical protein ACRDS1_18375 [Pseudonocardiaceae bacterium]
MGDTTIDELMSRAAPLRDRDLDRPAVRDAAYAVVSELARRDAAVDAPRKNPGIDKPTRKQSLAHRRKKLVAGAAVAVLAIGTGTAAAQELLSARTGRQAPPMGETPTGGEWIRLDAPDAVAVLVELAEPIPVPPGTDAHQLVATLLTDEPTEITDHGAQGSIAWTAAACTWPRYWLGAKERGDPAAMAAAQRVLDAAPTWQWITASDGGGVADALQATADAVRQGNTTSVKRQLADNCAPTSPE